MKNKKLMYILLPVTAIVWGLIIYKIISAVSSDEDFVNTNSIPPTIGTKDSIPVREITLLANYRDPFLGKPITKIDRTVNNTKRQLNIAPITVANVVPAAIWPQISYVGIIENKKKMSKVAILRIDNSELLLKEKDVSNNILVEKIYKDSIQLVFNKERKIFKK